MSDSDAVAGAERPRPGGVPADAAIEQCLRRVVRDALDADEEITTNLARARAEAALGLPASFLKDRAEWKKRSKDVISAAVVEEQPPPSSPEPPANKKKAKSAPKPAAQPSAAKTGAKRKSGAAHPPQKRLKKEATPVSNGGALDDDASEEETRKDQPRNAVRQSKVSVGDGEKVDEDDEAENADDAQRRTQQEDGAPSDADEHPASPTAAPANGGPADVDDESDLSSVIDEPAPKKKRGKKSTSPSEARSKAKKKPEKPAKAGKELSAGDEEIKRLQGWLAKCGIRKVWGRELKKFDTERDKIRHLKQLLADVGMTGRYSADKARQIKESRELAAELEAAKEFNKQWGQKGSGDGDDDDDDDDDDEGADDNTDDDGDGGNDDGGQANGSSTSRRLRPKGLVDFGDSGDEGSD